LTAGFERPAQRFPTDLTNEERRFVVSEAVILVAMGARYRAALVSGDVMSGSGKSSRPRARRAMAWVGREQPPPLPQL